MKFTVDVQQDSEAVKGEVEVRHAGVQGREPREGHAGLRRRQGARAHRAGPRVAVRSRARRSSRTAPSPSPRASDSVWDKIAQCESGGNWSHQHRQRLLRRPAVQRRDVAQRRRTGPAAPAAAVRCRSSTPRSSRPARAGASGAAPTRGSTDASLGCSEPRTSDAWPGACGIRPTKQRGQNFVIDANTVRRIVRTSGVGADDVVVEIGPGLGSLTLGLLEVAAHVTAVEIDEVLAAQLPVDDRDVRARPVASTW